MILIKIHHNPRNWKLYCVEHRQKQLCNAYYKITPNLAYYLNISVQAANLSDCRIESTLFFARIGMLYCSGHSNRHLCLLSWTTRPMSQQSESTFDANEMDFLVRQGNLRLGEDLRYDTRCYFNVRSKADMSQFNLSHGNNNYRPKKCTYVGLKQKN